ncbi:MAG: Rieske (2Fe-2S) protein, partial [Candidatus Promineifilaceae bacterium]
GAGKDGTLPADLTETLLKDDPAATIATLLAVLRSGVAPTRLAREVAYAAVMRIARFHTSNEFPDWDTALHTFTFANAVHEGLRRTNSAEPTLGIDLVRGIFDAAMSIYLDRFLNIPAAKLPSANGHAPNLEAALSARLNQQQQVNQSAQVVTNALADGVDSAELLATLGKLLLREDRDFHTIQSVEAAMKLSRYLEGTPEGGHVLIACTRYLAAHSPTVRSQGQTFAIAQRLHKGDKLFEG